MLNLHLGCGKNIKPNWHNLDQFPGEGGIEWDAREGLNYGDNSVDKVFSEDFLEHLPPDLKIPLMNEIWRVLKPGGTMEHFVPNAGSRNDFGSPSHLSHWNLQQFEHFDVDSYRWEKDRKYEGFEGGFKKVLAEQVNFQPDEGGIRAQSIHVIYEKV